MARLVVRIRILPAEAESNLENVVESIKKSAQWSQLPLG